MDVDKAIEHIFCLGVVLKMIDGHLDFQERVFFFNLMF